MALLTIKIVNDTTGPMTELEVIENPAAAIAALEPIRNRLLAELASPASAATLAARLGIARQKVNYHLRALESHGLVTLADAKRWGGITERRMVATATSYLVAPSALGGVASTPERTADRLSAAYLIALAARAINEVSAMARRARNLKVGLPTLSLDTEVRFRSAADRAAFTQDLTQSVLKLVAQYHDAEAPGGRPHRVIVLAHPLIQAPVEQSQS
jgi:DNA-binding transcriptional ArsR family regulator